MKSIENIMNCVSHVDNISKILKLKYYVHGGFVQDVMEGKMLRKHSYFKIFMENMDDNKDFIINYSKENGFDINYSKHIEMLHIDKDLVFNNKNDHISIIITSIKFQGKNAIWKYLGEKGFIYFPKDWLDKKYRDFYNLKLYTAGIRLEYCHRIFFRYIHPKWWHKDKVEKYIKALEYYENEIKRKNINPYKLFSNIWSYNPYYLGEGYYESNKYLPPVLVFGKDVVKNNNRTSSLMKEYYDKNKNKVPTLNKQ